MQALVSKTFGGDQEFSMQSKRLKSNLWNNSNESMAIPKRVPIDRLKLQFPNLNEEVSQLNTAEIYLQSLIYLDFRRDPQGLRQRYYESNKEAICW